MGDHVTDGLSLLAERFAAEGAWPQAVKCYEAQLQSGRALPASEANARLHLAQLLLTHTHNVHEARQHLERALLALNPLSGQLALRCEVLSQLSDCLGILQQAKQQRAACSRAIELCTAASTAGPQAGSQAAAAAWLQRLHLSAAALDAADGEWPAARLHAATAAALAEHQGQPQLQAAVSLFDLQLLLMEGSEAFEAAHLRVVQLLASPPVQQLLPELVAQLRLHAATLHALFLLRQGSLMQLCDTGTGRCAWHADEPGQRPTTPLQPPTSGQSTDMPTPARLQQLLAQASAGGMTQWQHSWLSLPEATALVAVLCSAVWRPCALLDKTLDAAARGLAALQPLLRSCGVDMQAGEPALSLHGHARGRLPLLLRALLQEAVAAAHLTRCDLTKAQGCIMQLRTTVAAFPTLLSPLRSSAHVLSGCYALTFNQIGAAVQHFVAAAETAPNASARQLAIVQAAAAEAVSGDAASVSRAIDRLSTAGLYPMPPKDLPHRDLAPAQLVAGVILLGQRQEGGKVLLTRALKVAHNLMNNQQLTAQILNAIGPVQQLTDLSGASNMLSSSYTLSKLQRDLPSQIDALMGLNGILACEDDGPAKQESNWENTRRKQQELQGCIDSAAANVEQHAQVLRLHLWCK